MIDERLLACELRRATPFLRWAGVDRDDAAQGARLHAWRQTKRTPVPPALLRLYYRHGIARVVRQETRTRPGRANHYWTIRCPSALTPGIVARYGGTPVYQDPWVARAVRALPAAHRADLEAWLAGAPITKRARTAVRWVRRTLGVAE